MIENAEPDSWSVVWSVIQKDQNFGREVFEKVAHRYLWGINLNIKEKQIATLYIWLVKQYPHHEDPVHDGAYNFGVK